MLCQFDFSQRSARRTPSKASLIDCILTINIWKSFGWCKKFCVYEHWKHNRADTNKEEITPWVIISFIFITWLLKIIWTLSITEDRNVLCRNKFEYDQNNHVSYCISVKLQFWGMIRLQEWVSFNLSHAGSFTQKQPCYAMVCQGN